MSYSTTTYNRRRSNWNRNQNTTRFTSSIKLGPVAHTVLIALMITVLGLIYLTQATKATSYDQESYAIDQQISELSQERSDLEVENARLTALGTVRDSSVARAMEEPASTSYVTE